MAENSAISWTDATVNFWWGCTKVGPGCDHCYAETLNNFRGNGMWGPGAPRRKIKGATALMRKLQREAPAWFKAHGRRRNVFMHSMSDVFDNEVDDTWRAEALLEAEAADQLNIMIVTKRVGNVAKMVPPHWFGMAWLGGPTDPLKMHWPQHVGLMITVVTQAEAFRDIRRLIVLKITYGIPWVGLSVEPMQEAITLPPTYAHMLDWVICGGESGTEARPMHPDWARSLRDQCAEHGVPFHFKQWGEYGADLVRRGKAATGYQLDGVEHRAMFRGCK